MENKKYKEKAGGKDVGEGVGYGGLR